MSIDTLSESPRFYESVRAIGKLYRSIDLPALRTVDRAARYQLRHMRQAGQDFLPTILGQFHTNRSSEEDVVFDAVRHHVAGFIDPGSYDRATVTSIWELYNSYVSRLRAICADHALENSRTAMLTEEEAVVSACPSVSSVHAVHHTHPIPHRSAPLSRNARSPVSVETSSRS